VATVTAALGLGSTRSSAPLAAADAPDSLRIITLESWNEAPAPGSRAVQRSRRPAGIDGRSSTGRAQDLTATRSGALVGRVDIRRAREATARRPSVSGLAAPQRSERPDVRSAVVYLESLPAGPLPPPAPMRARIDQRDETFVPHVLAITAGSVVDFPNSDRTYHNVFSLSRTRRFDLGRYAQGRSRAVRFDRPGIVRVFCDIHSHMSAYVLVFSHRFFGTTGEDGRYRIDGVPPGQYTVSAWYEGERRDTKTVTLPSAGGPADLDFSVP
jgi:plastocyanin